MKPTFFFFCQFREVGSLQFVNNFKPPLIQLPPLKTTPNLVASCLKLPKTCAHHYEALSLYTEMILCLLRSVTRLDNNIQW